MRRSLVIYDFAPDHSDFLNTRGKFYFIFYQCREPTHGKPRDTGNVCVREKENIKPNYHPLALCVHHLIEGGRSGMLRVYVSLIKCESGGVVPHCL
jgi:hypothetical protein